MTEMAFTLSEYRGASSVTYVRFRHGGTTRNRSNHNVVYSEIPPGVLP